LLTGCGTAVNTLEPVPVTITFAFPESDQGFFEQVVTQFNQDHPNITVELEPHSTNLSSIGLEKIDVFMAYPDDLRQFQDDGLVVNLDPFFENDQSFDLNDFYPGAMQLFKDNGKIWAIPAGIEKCRHVVHYLSLNRMNKKWVPASPRWRAVSKKRSYRR
jgi:ABC-type glycerol-3-phosphate transport system substrate-binding protein